MLRRQPQSSSLHCLLVCKCPRELQYYPHAPGIPARSCRYSKRQCGRHRQRLTPTRCATRGHIYQSQNEERHRIPSTNLGTSGEHLFTGIQSGPTGFLNFLDLTAGFSDTKVQKPKPSRCLPGDRDYNGHPHASHSAVGDHELDRDRSATWQGSLVKGFIINSPYDQSKGLSSNQCYYQSVCSGTRHDQFAYLGNGIQSTLDTQDPLGVTRN